MAISHPLLIELSAGLCLIPSKPIPVPVIPISGHFSFWCPPSPSQILLQMFKLRANSYSSVSLAYLITERDPTCFKSFFKLGELVMSLLRRDYEFLPTKQLLNYVSAFTTLRTSTNGSLKVTCPFIFCRRRTETSAPLGKDVI